MPLAQHAPVALAELCRLRVSGSIEITWEGVDEWDETLRMAEAPDKIVIDMFHEMVARLKRGETACP